MATMSWRTAKAVLAGLGWRVDTTARYNQAMADFQRGWNLGTALTVDGILGPKTSAALTASHARLKAGRGTCSAHFSFTEFRCKCGGRYASCRRCWVTRAQVQNMERYRAKVARPVSIVSGCRCTSHNRAVGGSSASRHLAGDACDIAGVLTTSQVRALKVFGGIGYKSATGRVLHADNRSGSRTSPTTWRYS